MIESDCAESVQLLLYLNVSSTHTCIHLNAKKNSNKAKLKMNASELASKETSSFYFQIVHFEIRL